MRCAGLELIIGLVLQGGTPSLAEDKVVKFRNEMQQADRTALEARHAEINKAFEDWQLNSSSHEPEKGSAVDHTYQFAVQQFPEVRNSDVCRSWPSDMAEMCRRMGEHWTAVELNSLHSFLTRFHHTLVKLSTPPRVESAYHPAARQCAANPEEVKQLFVSGAGFSSSSPDAETDDGSAMGEMYR